MVAIQENWQNIIYHTPAPIYGVSLDDNLVFINPFFEKYTGFSFEELSGRDWRYKLSWDDNLAGHTAIIDHLADIASHELIGATIIAKSGEKHSIKWNHLPIIADESGAQLILGFGIDRTKRQRAEEQVRQASDEWERTFDAINDIVTIQDTEMKITRINKAGCRALNASREDLVGKSCYGVFRGEDKPCPSCPEAQVMRDSEAHDGEIEHLSLGRKFMVSASPIFKDDGTFSGIVHIAKDITNQKMLESQLRQAQKMEAIGTLAGGIAHDFNNILGAILGYTDLGLLEDVSDSLRGNLEEIRRAGGRAKELVAQILAFSRQQETMTKPVTISSIIKEAAKLLRASLPSTIEMVLDLSAADDKIMADPVQIHQILLNLCTNALQAMLGKKGVLSIGLNEMEIAVDDASTAPGMPPGTYVVLEVSDTGAGMDRSTLARIFDPFFTTKKLGDGTGMGLSVVHGIVKGYGGEILVASELANGTTFKVIFPLLARTSEESGSEVASTPVGGKESILFVDDEETLARMGERMLSYLGYNVRAMADSAAALAEFKAQPGKYDLVITDFTMPNLTGVEMADEMLNIRPELPIILCTGFSEEVTEEKIKAKGLRKLVMKPLAIHDLASVVREVLGGE